MEEEYTNTPETPEENITGQQDETRNSEAWRLLDEAMFTSSLIRKKEREKGEVKTDHIYPASKAETERMEALLQQAKDSADDPNEPEFHEKYDMLNEIVQWSKGKYRTWNWSLIAGVALFIIFLFYMRGKSNDEAEAHKAQLAQVENWTPCDTTVTWQKCANPGTVGYGERHLNANKYKGYELEHYKDVVLGAEKRVADLQSKIDTCTDKDRKKSYLKSQERSQETAKKYHEKFDNLAQMKYKEVQKVAIEDVKGDISDARSGSSSLLVFALLCAVLIGLYIWTGYPYGYQLTKSRTRDKILSWVRKIGFGIAGALFGAGLAAKLFADDYIVKTTYSDGSTSTHREGDIGGTAINAIFKIGLMAVGVIIFVFISGLIMFIETWGGVRNKIAEFKAKKAAKVPLAEPAAEA